MLIGAYVELSICDSRQMIFNIHLPAIVNVSLKKFKQTLCLCYWQLR